MPNLALSAIDSAAAFGHRSGREAEVRRAYAQKRSIEEARQRALALSRIVETDIIPRLKLLHPSLAPAMTVVFEKPDAHQVEAFTQLLLLPDLSVESLAVAEHLSKGYSAEKCFLTCLHVQRLCWDECGKRIYVIL